MGATPIHRLLEDNQEDGRWAKYGLTRLGLGYNFLRVSVSHGHQVITIDAGISFLHFSWNFHRFLS